MITGRTPTATPWDLPDDRPFTSAGARTLGVTARQLHDWTEDGVVVPILKGVHRRSCVPDGVRTRVAALRLVVPADGVVTDRTAAFLHCAEHALAPGDHLAVPGVSVFRAPGYRLRNPVSDSGERTLGTRDVQVVHGVRCTTPLRTMADLGRLLHRDQAFAAMCALARATGVGREQLCAELPRYAGYRGVVQLRELASLVEPGTESPGESISLLRCHDVGIRGVVAQHVVPRTDGGHYRLDLAAPELMLAVEYEGEEFHGPEQQQADEDRRAWLRARGWTVVVLRRDSVHGPYQDAEILLRRAYDLARARTPLG